MPFDPVTIAIAAVAGEIWNEIFGRKHAVPAVRQVNIDENANVEFIMQRAQNVFGGSIASGAKFVDEGPRIKAALEAFIRGEGPLPRPSHPHWQEIMRFITPQIRQAALDFQFQFPGFEVPDARQPFQPEGGFAVSPPGEEFFMPGRNIIPPGGFAALAQQTPAGQLQQYGRTRVSSVRRPSRPRRAAPGGTSRPYFARKKRRAMRKGPVRRFKRRTMRARRMVKGSPEAKRYMAKLRAMQKKGRRRRRR